MGSHPSLPVDKSEWECPTLRILARLATSGDYLVNGGSISSLDHSSYSKVMIFNNALNRLLHWTYCVASELQDSKGPRIIWDKPSN